MITPLALHRADRMTGKATTWDEVDRYFGQIDLTGVPTFSTEQVYTVERFNGPCTYFKTLMPRFFVLVNLAGTFLVNTEGYNYARYAVRIED